MVRAVGYGQPPCKDVASALKPTTATHGQPAVDQAAKALLDYEQHGSQLYAKLKPHLHVYCRGLLGPMPSEWPTWWKNADGTDRKGKPAVWPPKLPGPPEPTEEELELRKLSIPKLAGRLHEARHRYVRAKPDSKAAAKAADEVTLMLAEYQRRGIVAPQTPEPAKPKTRLLTKKKREAA